MAKRKVQKVKKGGGKSPRKRTARTSTPPRVSDYHHRCIFHGGRSVFIVSSLSIIHDDLSFILAAHSPYSPGAQSPLFPTIDDRSSIQHRVGVSIGGHPRFARGCEIIACFYHISVLLPSITELFLFSFSTLQTSAPTCGGDSAFASAAGASVGRPSKTPSGVSGKSFYLCLSFRLSCD